jgi:hypothetical protein
MHDYRLYPDDYLRLTSVSDYMFAWRQRQITGGEALASIFDVNARVVADVLRRERRPVTH